MLGANLDIGHSVVMGEDIATILRLLKGRIWNCHIEDLMGRKHYHLIPGTGTFDWHALKHALEAIHYNRFLTVELYTCPDKPIEAARRSVKFLKPIFR
jgi:sugar phosphate isomerase/epimerase